jgi:hypothetical protein
MTKKLLTLLVPQRHIELAARAEYQHDMLIRGHHGMGIYGNFQPPAELRTPLLGIDA